MADVEQQEVAPEEVEVPAGKKVTETAIEVQPEENGGPVADENSADHAATNGAVQENTAENGQGETDEAATKRKADDESGEAEKKQKTEEDEGENGNAADGDKAEAASEEKGEVADKEPSVVEASA